MLHVFRMFACYRLSLKHNSMLNCALILMASSNMSVGCCDMACMQGWSLLKYVVSFGALLYCILSIREWNGKVPPLKLTLQYGNASRLSLYSCYSHLHCRLGISRFWGYLNIGLLIISFKYLLSLVCFSHL